MNTSGTPARQGQRLLRVGTALLVSSSLDGFVIPYLGSPRIGLSVHTLSAYQGVLLLTQGFLWTRLKLGVIGCRVAFWCLLHGTFAILAAYTVAAIWGVGNETIRLMGELPHGLSRGTVFQGTLIKVLAALVGPKRSHLACYRALGPSTGFVMKATIFGASVSKPHPSGVVGFGVSHQRKHAVCETEQAPIRRHVAEIVGESRAQNRRTDAGTLRHRYAQLRTWTEVSWRTAVIPAALHASTERSHRNCPSGVRSCAGSGREPAHRGPCRSAPPSWLRYPRLARCRCRDHRRQWPRPVHR